MRRTHLLVIGLLAASLPLTAEAQLRGSQQSMQRQYQVARDNDFTFLRNTRQLREFVEENRLVKLGGGRHYTLKSSVSFPYARPAVKLFVERIAEDFFNATGEKLVVTSLTRPRSRQPRNASDLSVHPAGMAVDFRVPRNRTHQRWLERVLLDLEDAVVLDVTKERRPLHYHVAVFPREYERYVAQRVANDND